MLAQQISVYKDGGRVFHAVAGEGGLPDSANREFICFASPIARAAGHYLSCEEWAERIAKEGYESVFVYEGTEKRIAAHPQGQAKKVEAGVAAPAVRTTRSMAKAMSAQDLAACAQNVITWQDKGKLATGPLHSLAERFVTEIGIDEMSALQQAEAAVLREASLRFIALQTGLRADEPNPVKP